MRTRAILRILAASALVLLLGVPTDAQLVVSEIKAVDLGTLAGGNSSAALDINNVGQIVGEGTTASGATHGFIISGGSMTDLGTLPGGDFSSASGINNLGQVVGTAQVRNSAGVIVFHGFEWESGVMRDLGAFPPEDSIGSESSAGRINDAGLIAGNVDLAGVVWDLSGIPNFPPFPPDVRVTDPGPFTPARANDINNSGQAVGKLLFSAEAFRWQSGVLELLTTIGPGDDNAFGVNQAGAAVGEALLPPGPLNQHHAVLWPVPGGAQDLGTLGGANSAARDINDAGTVVGFSETASGNRLAFIWRADLGMQSLGTLGGANSEASAINAAGQIVGVSETASGERHATLWTVQLATAIAIDIKPRSCPNPLNTHARGVLPVAILGTATFDVTQVDVATVKLEGVSPVRSSLEDVATPFALVTGKTKATDCTTAGPDGFLDLTLKFDNQAVVAALGTVADREIRVLRLTGNLSNGMPIVGQDVVVVLAR